MPDSLFTYHIVRVGFTEDGDVIFARVITATGFAGIQEARDYARESGWNDLEDWTGIGGGKLQTRQEYVVDGAEVAIEANNDAAAWASAQREEDEARRCGHYGYLA